jgi:uncharacterized protein (TIGR03083 family)
MAVLTSTQMAQSVELVPYVTADEAYSLMKIELEQFLKVVEGLAPDDWSQPTACSDWTVRDIVAHQAGSYASGKGYREMFRMSSKPKPGQLIEDAINEKQLSERANRTPAELIDEIRAAGPVAIRKWAYQFRLAKRLSLPHPIAGALSIRDLMWVIHSRDPWMHRLDICRATGREFERDEKQDGRITALVVRDAAKVLKRRLGDVAVLFDLTGTGGGTWRTGQGDPSAEIQMDVLDFNIFASGRYGYEEARARALLSGDLALAEQVMRNLLVLY